uniref:Uncharacterized protein n=1 Tax=Picea glauca TaxID=3330 RepID=A0A117NJ17_PICGL|nr:hypothetical protein ABT39_MTgene685 [Picea glauca]
MPLIQALLCVWLKAVLKYEGLCSRAMMRGSTNQCNR